MALAKIKKGDFVQVLAGKDKGKRGKVLQVFPDMGKATVEGINVQKKHQKPNPQRETQGGIVEREGKVQISNLMIVDPNTDKPDRVGVKVLEDGRKVRVFKRSGEVVLDTKV